MQMNDLANKFITYLNDASPLLDQFVAVMQHESEEKAFDYVHDNCDNSK